MAGEDLPVVHRDKRCVGTRKLVIFAKPDDFPPLSSFGLLSLCIVVFEVSYESMRSKGMDERRLRKFTAKFCALHIHTDEHVLSVCFSSHYHLPRDSIGGYDSEVKGTAGRIHLWDR